MIYTLNEVNAMRTKAFSALLEHAGSSAHLAKMLGVPPQAVQHWRTRGYISKSGAQKVDCHQALGDVFTREDLRPDIVTW